MPENNERKTDFLQSLDSITADEIKEKKKKKRRVSDMIFDNLRYLLIGVCSVMLIISSSNLIKSFQDNVKHDEAYGALDDYVMKNDGVEMMFSGINMPLTPDYKTSQALTKDDLSDYGNVAPINKDYARIRVRLVNLKSSYPDLYGWITVHGTGISYPIMQAANNQYYLDHSYTGASLTAGAIYADCTCDKKLMNNRNLVIFGHHMANGSMFNQLDNFLKESFYRNNGKVTVYTLDGMYTYQVFSVYETDKYYPYIRTYFPSGEQFVSFAETMEQNSIYKGEDIVFTPESKILTLSTCNNRLAEGRLAVHAVMTEYYLNPNS